VKRSDLELLDAWHTGDTAAANELFDRWFRQLYMFFRTKVDDGVAEDLVQQTLLSCVQNLEVVSSRSKASEVCRTSW
jgi:DNA-directed RNA polymerase specialized sigma24 family protein